MIPLRRMAIYKGIQWRLDIFKSRAEFWLSQKPCYDLGIVTIWKRPCFRRLACLCGLLPAVQFEFVADWRLEAVNALDQMETFVNTLKQENRNL
eukprot:889370-Amphidinium_carterae.2